MPHVIIEKQIIHEKNGHEEFNSFFNFFKQDTSFQFQRTDTPYIKQALLVTINAAGDLKSDITTSINKTDWEPAYWLSQLPSRIELFADSSIVIYYDTVLNRAVKTDYIFVKTEGKWHYKTIRIN